MTINEAGGVIDTQGQTATLNGRLSGAGELTKDGSGTLVLTDAGNSYSGNTLIRNGTLRLNGAGWITGDVTNLGIFEFANSGDHDFAGSFLEPAQFSNPEQAPPPFPVITLIAVALRSRRVRLQSVKTTIWAPVG
ncbi:hypothetical protein HGG76_20705 [Ochrobactrum tritici]|uniref:Outer membrane autotransporter n=1 Tax=Brucella tritici TaxID=94626 RepID=A0A7X6JBA5_9HYPH|nr:hypothetical protein [Brucella tritici]